jgi:hypothetical protein
MAVRQRVLPLAGSFLERWLNRDTSDYAGPHLARACRAEARHAGRRDKRFRSALGELLHELAGVPVDAKQVERTAEALGAEIAEDERHHLEPSHHLDLPQTLYLGMYGTGIPMRSHELAGRAGKQPDGSAKTRAVKLCTVWTAEGRDPNGAPVWDEASVTHSAAIESAATADPTRRPEFNERFLRETTRHRFCPAQRRAVLGDSAHWIWNIAHQLFPGAIEIVDRFHAQQHLGNLG